MGICSAGEQRYSSELTERGRAFRRCAVTSAGLFGVAGFCFYFLRPSFRLTADTTEVNQGIGMALVLAASFTGVAALISFFSFPRLGLWQEIESKLQVVVDGITYEVKAMRDGKASFYHSAKYPQVIVDPDGGQQFFEQQSPPSPCENGAEDSMLEPEPVRPTQHLINKMQDKIRSINQESAIAEPRSLC